jgi:hypothetical protein
MMRITIQLGAVNCNGAPNQQNLSPVGTTRGNRRSHIQRHTRLHHHLCNLQILLDWFVIPNPWAAGSPMQIR